jgi:hypothetical protein
MGNARRGMDNARRGMDGNGWNIAPTD